MPKEIVGLMELPSVEHAPHCDALGSGMKCAEATGSSTWSYAFHF